MDVNQKNFLFENTNSLFSDFFLIGFFLVVLLQRMVSHFIVLISQVLK